MLAAALATTIRSLAPDTTFAGIGNERMEDAGIALTQRTTGWASLGPIEALKRIPPLLWSCIRHAFWLRGAPWDLVVLVDFGAFNLRLARLLRRIGYRRPILYLVPPGAWFDKPKQAREVARYATPLTPFAHQRAFYESLGLPVISFGHPLVSLVAARATRPVAPAGGGVVAILPGSRSGEIDRHMPRLIAACKIVRARRPSTRFAIAAADRALPDPRGAQGASWRRVTAARRVAGARCRRSRAGSAGRGSRPLGARPSAGRRRRPERGSPDGRRPASRAERRR